MQFRKFLPTDIPALASIRAQSWGTEEYWVNRITKYVQTSQNPQQAKRERTIFVAIEEKQIIGLVAGHLTTRFGCEGELQWINVLPAFQGKEIATQLFKLIADWFVKKGALYICVNVEPDNTKGIHFYTKNGAEKLDDHWMIWKDISKTL